MAGKLKLSKLRKLESQSIFLVLALFMCIIVGGFAVYSIVFIGSNIDRALEVQPLAAPAVKFDIQGFQDLKLIR